MVDDDLHRRLDDVERDLGLDDGHTLYLLPGVGAGGDAVDLSPYTVESSFEAGGTDTEATVERVTLPKHKPQSVRGGVHCLDAADVVELWEPLPDDVRDRELEIRLEAGDPIPPILQQ